MGTALQHVNVMVYGSIPYSQCWNLSCKKMRAGLARLSQKRGGWALGDGNNEVPGRILMQRTSSLKIWDPQSLYVAKKKGYVKVCMFVREHLGFPRREQGDV